MEPLVLRSASDAAEWFLAAMAFGTLLVAGVALFQDRLRQLVWHPNLRVSIIMEPPDCHMITLGTGPGAIDTFYLRLRVENDGNVVARDVEVYAAELRMLNQSNQWSRLGTFLPMNLLWSHMGQVTHYPLLAPGTARHCDLANVIDPARRAGHLEENPSLGLSAKQTSMRLNVMVYPNHKGEIVGPGQYQLDIVVAASNGRPRQYSIDLNLSGTWHSNEAQMLTSGVGASVREA